MEVATPAGTAGADILDRLLHLAPAAPFVAPPGLATALRPYQQTGVDWLRFLAENRLAGLISDGTRKGSGAVCEGAVVTATA